MNNFWKNLKKPIKILAPMEDVTDTVFRQLVNGWGRPDVFFTEFTNASGLGSEGRENVIQRFKYTEKERPIVAQIWGTDAEMHYKSAQLVKKLGFDGVDINMGCPVKKIVKKGACSALIDNQPLAKELIQATKEGSKGLPVSVKTRIGYKTKKTEEWSEFLLNQDIQVLTLHGRTAKDMSKVPADWNEIKKAVKIRDKLKKDTLIIGNGDVKNLEDLNNKYIKYGVDGIMIGRAIFNDVFFFNPNKSMEKLNKKERLELLEDHIKLFQKTWGKEKNYSSLKKYFKIYVSDFKNASNIRNDLMQTENYRDAYNLISKLK